MSRAEVIERTISEETAGVRCGHCGKRSIVGEAWAISDVHWIGDRAICYGHKKCVEEAIKEALSLLQQPEPEAYDDPKEWPHQIRLRAKTKKEFYCKLRAIIPEDLFALTKTSQLIIRQAQQKAEAVAARVEAENKCCVLRGEIEKLKEENRWIPVSERLPEMLGIQYRRSGRVLVYITFNLSEMTGGVRIGWLDEECGWQVGGEGKIEVTHWKPIVLPDQALKDQE